ncbi:lytic murein transglycosylase [Saccharopolyspora sp. HNM0983]|uniref:Lytic murein transglycosylase n=1 Tax=Saccharopolyspora montiporae TaxID=2781240 RepID=A0A929B9H1_9PSEU|nr:lytic transglycosylase domain-containing protein [Saccharopolyspora sp. HNM0983]MBE9373886.1 lytic murein transglycosylase [Saccharopolyspora sp. HNM0983]
MRSAPADRGSTRSRRRPIAALAPALLLPAALVVGAAPLLQSPEDPEPPRELGATGELPRQPAPGPELLDRAQRPDVREQAPPDEEVPAPDHLGIPEPVLAGYRGAAESLQRTRPQCGVHWSLLASIGRIESAHARDGAVDADGTAVRAILGPRLSGGSGVAAIPDTDGGRYDGDPVWDRAVGPMQFIPSTWQKHGTDGNGDGVADPHNVHDAAAAAGEYLCSGGGDLGDRAQAAEAVFGYNRSEEYVRTVLTWADAYARGVLPTPVDPPPPARGDVLAGQRLPADDSPLIIPDLPPVDEHPAAAPPPQDAAPAPEPPEIRPLETEPAETEPLETEPPETEPAETEPLETEPPETEPAEIRPPSPDVSPPDVGSPSAPQVDPPAAPQLPSEAGPQGESSVPGAPGDTATPGTQPSTSDSARPSAPAPSSTGIGPVPMTGDPGALQPCEVAALRTGEVTRVAEPDIVGELRPGEVVHTGEPGTQQPCRVPESYRP